MTTDLNTFTHMLFSILALHNTVVQVYYWSEIWALTLSPNKGRSVHYVRTHVRTHLLHRSSALSWAIMDPTPSLVSRQHDGVFSLQGSGAAPVKGSLTPRMTAPTSTGGPSCASPASRSGGQTPQRTPPSPPTLQPG